MDVDIGCRAEVSLGGEGPGNSGGGSARYRACVHLAEHHPCRLNEAERCVYGEEFAGRAGF